MNLENMNLQSVIKAFGADKPWKQTGENPMRWASNFVQQKLNEQGKVLEPDSVGFVDGEPAVVETFSPEKLLEAKEDITKIFEHAEEEIAEVFTKGHKVYNELFTEVVVKEDLNWIAKLQLTELPVTFKDEDGYTEALENYFMFIKEHDKAQEQTKELLNEMTDMFVEGQVKAEKKAKKAAYQTKVAQEQEEEQVRKAAIAKAHKAAASKVKAPTIKDKVYSDRRKERTQAKQFKANSSNVYKRVDKGFSDKAIQAIVTNSKGKLSWHGAIMVLKANQAAKARC